MNIKLLGRLQVIVGMIELWNGLKENIFFFSKFCMIVKFYKLFHIMKAKKKRDYKLILGIA
jgi:hypothetical protein